MTTNKHTQEWLKITDGGIGKAHFSTYMCEIIEDNHTIVGGKIIFRGGITKLNEVYIYALSADEINKKVINELLIKNMIPFSKNYNTITTVTIDGVSHTILIFGYSESTFKGLFTGRHQVELPNNSFILSQLS